MKRTRLYAEYKGVFLHDAILGACQQFAAHTAIVDYSAKPAKRLTYAEYGELVQRAARGFVAQGIKPGEVIAIFLANSWEYAVSFHAAQLCGAIPTLLNPTYREREIRYQVENSGAVTLVTDATQIAGINLKGLPSLRSIIAIRNQGPGTIHFTDLLRS